MYTLARQQAQPLNVKPQHHSTVLNTTASYSSGIRVHPTPPASKPLIRLAFQSALKLGRPEEALTLYQRLVPTGQPDDPALLRPLALSFLTSHIRDTQEYVRIEAFTILAELGLSDIQAVLEDGLLDASVLVRARAADAIGKAGLAGKSGPLRRALSDADATRPNCRDERTQ